MPIRLSQDYNATTRDIMARLTCHPCTRHFNKITTSEYIVRKESVKSRKIQGEYRFYHLLPEYMRPWHVETFNLRCANQSASYDMLRYYVVSASFFWIHGKFNKDSFQAFLDRIFYYFSIRQHKSLHPAEARSLVRSLFFDKVAARLNASKQMRLFHDNPSLSRTYDYLVKRYRDLTEERRALFKITKAVVAHGDLCFTNILWDYTHHFMKFCDPKGANSVSELYSHPFYDYMKLSQCILGGYDFIINDLYKIHNRHLIFGQDAHHLQVCRELFITYLARHGINLTMIRLGEVSLFLSMIPLHVDRSDHIRAFLLIAENIMDTINEAS